MDRPDEIARRRASRRLWALFLIPAVVMLVWEERHPGASFLGLPPIVVRTLISICGALALLTLIGRSNCPGCDARMFGARKDRCPYCGTPLP